MIETTLMPISMKMTDLAACRKELRVEVSADAVAAELEEVYKDLRKKARVPGFRVGFAPRDLLERHHGSAAREEMLERLVPRALEEVLRSNGKLDVVGRPQISGIQWEPGKPLTYLATIEIAPQVPMKSYKGLKLTRAKVHIEEETVHQVLSRLQETHAQLKPVLEPRASAAGDYLLVDVTESKKGAAGAGTKQRDLVIELNLEKDPQGILKQLVGVTPPAQRVITLPSGSTLTVDVKEIKVKETQPVDDAFAKSVGPFDSLEILKESIRGNLRREAENNQRRLLDRKVCDRLLEEWRFDVPPSMVASQARRILKERAVELMSQGVPEAEVQERTPLLTDQAKLDALKDVKLFFILRRIAAAEQMSATQEEVAARIQALAAGLRIPVEKLQADLEKKDLVDEIVWGVVRQKVLDLIIREAQVEERGDS